MPPNERTPLAASRDGSSPAGVGDLEKQGADEASDLYGSAEVGKLGGGSRAYPLLLGFFDVSPAAIYRFFIGLYAVVFFVYRLVDVAYYATIDARFPEGLGHFYPSEWERQQTVAYTKEVLVCTMSMRVVLFCAVMTLMFFGTFAKADAALHSLVNCCCGWAAFFHHKLFKGFHKGFEGGMLHRCVCLPCTMCAGAVSWCCSPCSRCCSAIIRFCGFRLTWRELLHGAVFLSLFAAAFFLITAPFKYWMHSIDVAYGFSNPLTITPGLIKQSLVSEFISLLIMGIPGKFLFLLVLQCRYGWLAMWLGTIAMILFVQANITHLAPSMLGMNTPFPADTFAVGRGFPLARTGLQSVPWVSLNRLYYRDGDSEFPAYYTHDKSRGDLMLSAPNVAKPWRVEGQLQLQEPFAKSATPAGPRIDHLRDLDWVVQDQGTVESRMGLRDGKELLDKVHGFAHQWNITVDQIYMVDGSHKDVRANAFVAGAMNGSVIGLYDTLFLGSRGGSADDSEDDDDGSDGDAMSLLARGQDAIQFLSQRLRNVDRMEGAERRPRNSAPTQAMDDMEILAILGHELAHARLNHMQNNLLLQTVTSFTTFAVLGWMAASPLVAAALSLSAPLIHVGVGAYEHVVSPQMDRVMKLASDALTRKGEYEADGYVAKASSELGYALQTSLAKLSVNANQDPDIPWFYEVLHADHPCFAQRSAHIVASMKDKKK